MEGYRSGVRVFFARLGVGDGWAECFAKTAIRLAIATHTDIRYFKNLALDELMRDARYISEVLGEREGE